MVLERSEMYPLGPETAMFRALPPVELHLTRNVDEPVFCSYCSDCGSGQNIKSLTNSSSKKCQAILLSYMDFAIIECLFELIIHSANYVH